MFTSRSTTPAACGGAMTTISFAVLSTHVPPAPPNFTYAKQFAKPHATGPGKRAVPCTWTNPPPVVGPLAGVTVDRFGCAAMNVGHNSKHARKMFLMTLSTLGVVKVPTLAIAGAPRAAMGIGRH